MGPEAQRWVSFMMMTSSSCSYDPGRTTNLPKYDPRRGMFDLGRCLNEHPCQTNPLGKQERRMSNFVIRMSVLAAFSMALIAAPSLKPAFAAGGDTPSPPASDSKATKEKKKKTSEKDSSIEDPAFLNGYPAPYSTIYEHGDYAAAIEQLKALGHEDRADVANLIGYSY